MNEHPDIMLEYAPRDISAWRWIAAFAAFLAAGGGCFLLCREVQAIAHLEILIILLVYMSLACLFIPLPTTWIILWAARSADPMTVALIGTIGTCMANLHDYYIVNYLSGLRRAQRFKETAFYRRSVGWFERAPFLTLAAASFIPIPIDVVRVLAVTTGYSRRMYVLATLVGRFPRYLLLAYLGYELKLSNTALLVALIIPALIGAARGLMKLRDKRRSEDG